MIYALGMVASIHNKVRATEVRKKNVTAVKDKR